MFVRTTLNKIMYWR